MLLKTRHPLTRWAAALASAAVVAAGSLGIAPTASAVPRFANQIAWTAPTMAVPYGTAITAVAGSGQFTLTPQTYSAGTWTPGTPVTTSSPVVAQAYDANGVAVDMTTITLPAATCALYAATDTTYRRPLTGTIAGPANYVTRCTAASTVAGYANAYVNGRGVVQGEATLTVTYPGLKSVDAVTTLGSYPSTLGYTSVKKNGISAAAPIATCGIYAAADTTYTGTNYAGLTAPVGSYKAHCAYNADPLWSTTYNGDVALTVVGTPTTTTVNCPTNVTYNGSAQTPCTATVTGNGLNLSVTPTYTNNTNAGTATASYSYAGDTLYAPSSGSANFTIDPNASSTVVTCPASVSYNGQAQTPCSVAVTATDGLSLNFALTDPTAYSSNTNAGTASVSYTWPGDANHTSSTGTATFQIHAASTTTVTCPASVVYTGTAQTPCTVTVTDGGALNLTFDANYSANTNVGTVTASYSWPGDATHDPSSGSATFAITPAASTVTVNCPASVVYNGSAQTPCTATITGAGGLNSTVALASGDYSNNTNVGTATASYTYTGDANHSSATSSNSFGITQRAETLTASSGSITYGGSFTAGYAFNPTLPNGDLTTAPTCAVYATADTLFANPLTGTFDAGSYVTHCSGAVVSANIALTYADGTLTVAQASSTSVITCNPTSVVYNAVPQTPCSVTVTGAGGLNITTLPTYANNTNVGTATASYTYSGDANHTGSTATPVTFTITKASSTTTVNCPTSVVYTGTAQTPCTVTVTDGGALNLTFDANYSANTNVGTVTASYSWPGDATHDPSSGSATFAITPAASTVTVNCPASVVYNGSAQTPCSVTITAPGISTTATPTYTNNTNVGTATASYTYAGTANVNGSTGSATFAITKASVTITASSPAAITYGANVPAITYTSSVPALTWNPAITCAVYASGDTAFATALTGVQNAGTYVTHCANGVNANYTPTYVDGSLTINKAAATVTASSATIANGAATPAITFTTNPTPITWTTTPTCAVYTTADTTFATPLTGNRTAGTYVTHCANGVSVNYTPSYVNGTLTVTAAATPVTVTASTSTITYGATVPAVTFTTNPTPITWTTTPTCAVYTTADTTFATALTGVQNAGTYVTHCANGAATGYAPSYVNGALTISKAATVSVTASTPAAITYGAALPTVTSTTPTGGWTTAPTCGVYRTAGSATALTGIQNAGAYVTKCSGGVAVNYTTVTYVNGTLTINKAAVTITAQTTTGTRGGRIPTPTSTSNPTTATYTTAAICRVYNTTDTLFATPLTGNFPNAAGTYVTRCTGAVSTNYTPSYVNGTITVA